MKEIELTQGKVTLVDDEDFDRANCFDWYANFDGFNWYARKNHIGPDGKQYHTKFHHFILPGHSQIDHKNGNGLDNQKHNLRPATSFQNSINRKKRSGLSSQFKGVCWYAACKCWRADIMVGGHQIYLGRYDNEKDAAHVYDYAAQIHFGEFAKLNFPITIQVSLSKPANDQPPDASPGSVPPAVSSSTVPPVVDD